MNRIFKITFSVLLIAIVTGLIYVNLNPQRTREFKVRMPSVGRGSTGGEYVTAFLNCSLPEVPKEVLVLKVIRHNYTYAEVEVIAREIFDMKGELNITTPAEWYGKAARVTNGTQVLELYDDSALCYRPNSQEKGYGVKLPKLSEAKKIADQFLTQFIEKAKSHGLMPSFPSIKFFKVDYVCWYGIPPAPTVPIEIGVGYKTLYNGIPLIYKGGIGVIIGDNGKILEFRCYWRNVEFTESVQITVSPEQAIQNMGSHTSFGRSAGEIQNITINSIEFGYFTPPSMMDVDELLPAYEIRFFVALKDGSGYDWGAYVPATNIPG